MVPISQTFVSAAKSAIWIVSDTDVDIFRVDLDKYIDYRAIKKYLLQEMQLSPCVYLDKFQSISHESIETYHQFANKLSSLFEKS